MISLKDILIETELKDIKFVERDLLNVGKTKALGYLPIKTIKSYGDENSVNDLVIWAKKNNIKSKLFTTGNVASGALYFWDESKLKKILNKYKSVLKDAGVPIKPYDYVNHIHHNLVPEQQYPMAYKVVGHTFNDSIHRNI